MQDFVSRGLAIFSGQWIPILDLQISSGPGTEQRIVHFYWSDHLHYNLLLLTLAPLASWFHVKQHLGWLVINFACWDTEFSKTDSTHCRSRGLGCPSDFAGPNSNYSCLNITLPVLNYLRISEDINEPSSGNASPAIIVGVPRRTTTELLSDAGCLSPAHSDGICEWLVLWALPWNIIL